MVGDNLKRETLWSISEAQRILSGPTSFQGTAHQGEENISDYGLRHLICYEH